MDAQIAAVEVQLPDLVESGHGDVKLIAGLVDVPWGPERDEPAIAASMGAEGLLAGARQGGDFQGFEIDGPDRVVLGVGDVESRPVEVEALRVVEGGLACGSVFENSLAGADDGGDRSEEVGPEDAVVVRVGDEESMRRGEDLAGEGQGSLARAIALQLDFEGAAVDQALGVILGDHGRKHVVERFDGELSLVLANDLAVRSDEHERGPGACGVLSPDYEVGVVDDRVLYLVAHDGPADVVGRLFSVELGGVDSDYDHLGGVLLFQFPQLRKHVHTVNSTVGPEVQDDDLALEVAECERAFGVQPVEARRELRGIHVSGKPSWTHAAVSQCSDCRVG